MRLLLDECIPRRLGCDLAPHEVRTVQQAGWAGLNICAIALAARSNDIRDLEPLVPNLLAALSSARPGEVVRVAA